MTRRRSWLQYETEICWFVLVSILDIVLTYLILRYSSEGRSQNRMMESNPVAQWFLRRWGFPGMAGFKLFLTAFVCGVAEYVGIHKSEVGRGLLKFGTLIVGCVVVYSLVLLKTNVRLPLLERFF